MLAWPAVQQLLSAAQAEGKPFDFCSPERQRPTGMLQPHTQQGQSFPSTIGTHPSAPPPVSMTAPNLNWDTIQSLSKAYFDNFNLIYPILDRHAFLSAILPVAFNEGFGQAMGSTIAFLVFALGEVAIASSDGHPVHVNSGRASGVRGGTKERPPGLGYFNEARKRMGFNLTECSIENIQIFALAA